MTVRAPRLDPALEQQVGGKVAKSVSLLEEVLDVLSKRETGIRKTSGEVRQGYLRDSIRVLNKLSTGGELEDADLGVVSLDSLAQSLEETSARVAENLLAAMSKAGEKKRDVVDRIARLEAANILLERASRVLDAPNSDGDEFGKIAFDLGDALDANMEKISSLLETLDKMREAESSRVSSIRSQIQKALSLLSLASVLPSRSSRIWWKATREVPQRNRLGFRNGKVVEK